MSEKEYTIKLKRGEGEPNDGLLETGEPAFDYDNNKLYIGGKNKEPILINEDFEDNGVGKDTTMGEIFNNYTENIAAGKGFKILDYEIMHTGDLLIKLDSILGLSIDDICTITLNKTYINCGRISEINKLGIPYVMVIPTINPMTGYNKDETDEKKNILRILKKPNIGTIKIVENSHAEGNKTEALGENSHAQNRKSKAYGKHSHAQNYDTLAQGESSTAMGVQTKAYQKGCIAEGNMTEAGDSTGASDKMIVAHAEGHQTKAIAFAAHAEGQFNQSLGIASHAEGSSTIAGGNYTHTEGSGSQAYKPASHAEGGSTIAGESPEGVDANIVYPENEIDPKTYIPETGGNSGSGIEKDWGSHAEGLNTRALAMAAHSEGEMTKANKYASHAEGIGTIANTLGQHVEGVYNLEDTSQEYLHIVGNGKNDKNRSNAHTLDWEGNAWFAGNITVGDNKRKVVTREGIVIGHASNGETLDTCDVLYNDGDDFKATFTTACTLLNERDENTITILSGDYVAKNYIDLNTELVTTDEEIKIVGENFPRLSLDDDAICHYGFLTINHHVTIEGIHFFGIISGGYSLYIEEGCKTYFKNIITDSMIGANRDFSQMNIYNSHIAGIFSLFNGEASNITLISNYIGTWAVGTLKNSVVVNNTFFGVFGYKQKIKDENNNMTYNNFSSYDNFLSSDSLSFDDDGNLIVTLNGVSKKFIPATE